jgi:hypothetical protein
MFHVKQFDSPRLKPVRVAPEPRVGPAQRAAVRKSVERKAIRSFYTRAIGYDRMNLYHAREFLRNPASLPFQTIYARLVIARLGTPEERAVWPVERTTAHWQA